MLEGKKVVFKAGGDFPTFPPDKYTAQITDVNFKSQFNSFRNQDEEGLNYEFTILDNKTYATKSEDGKEEPESIRGRKLWRYFSPNEDGIFTLGGKSVLKKLVEAVLHKTLTKEEKETFDPESIVGKQVDIFVELIDGEGKHVGKKFNNITSFIPNSQPLPPLDKQEEAEVKVVNENSASPDDFIKSLEDDQKKEAEAAKQEQN